MNRCTSQCKGITRKGNRCKRRAEEYCYLHTPPEDDKKCPICSEIIDERITIHRSQAHYSLGTLSKIARARKSITCVQCNGCFHVRCIESMIDFKCPLCKESLETQMSDKTIKRIQKNIKKKDKEGAAEARQIEANYKRDVANTFNPRDRKVAVYTAVYRLACQMDGCTLDK